MERYCWKAVLEGEEGKGLTNERLPLLTPVTGCATQLVSWAFVPYKDRVLCYEIDDGAGIEHVDDLFGSKMVIRAIYRRYGAESTRCVDLYAISWFWPFARAGYWLSTRPLWMFVRHFGRFRYWLHRRFGLRNPEMMDWKQLLLCWRSTPKGAP